MPFPVGVFCVTGGLRAATANCQDHCGGQCEHPGRAVQHDHPPCIGKACLIAMSSTLTIRIYGLPHIWNGSTLALRRHRRCRGGVAPARRGPAGRGLQPRLVFAAARCDRAAGRIERPQCARSAPHLRFRPPAPAGVQDLPAVILGNLRGDGITRPGREHGAPPGEPLWYRQTVCPRDGGLLPQAIRPVRRLRHPVQSRKPAAAVAIRVAEDRPCGGGGWSGNSDDGRARRGRASDRQQRQAPARQSRRAPGFRLPAITPKRCGSPCRPTPATTT